MRIAAFTAARNASATSSLRDESLEESANLPDPDVLAQKIVEDLEAALEQFREIASDLNAKNLREVRGSRQFIYNSKTFSSGLL